MQIYIRRNNEEFGPYSREAVLEYVKQGVFRVVDRACYAGTSEWKTIGELLEIKPGYRSAGNRDLPRPAKITEFNPTWTPPPVPPKVPERQGKRGPMIALNLFLLLVVATVSYIRLAGKGDKVSSYLASWSGQFAKAANEPPPASATPAPAAATPAIAKAPAATPASTPAAENTPPSTPPPAAASTPDLPAPAAVPSPSFAPTPAPEAAAVAPSDTTPAATPTPAPSAAPPPPPGPPKPFDPADLAGNPAAWPKTVRLKQAVVFPAMYNSQVVGSVTAPAGTVVNLVNIQGDQLTLQFQGGTQTLSWKLTDLEEEAAKSGSPPPSPAGN